jgi:activator of HSP90 ATPase
MATTIQQKVILPATPGSLFDMYMSPEIHSAIIQSPVTISPEPGSLFQAFDQVISGKMLCVAPKYMIVQTWRALHWAAEDIDSVLVLTFRPAGEVGCIELVHVNVADHDAEFVAKGWEKYYWRRWREYLSGRSV